MERLLLQYEVEQWLYREAEYLDHLDFQSWLALMAEDVVYQMPIRMNVSDTRSTQDYSRDTFIFNDDRNTLQMRVDRLNTDFAWAESPPSRTRRFITNVRLVVVEPEIKALCNVLIYRSRGTDIEADLISGERQDVLRREGDSLKLVRRWFLIDQTTINTRNFAIFV